MLLRRALPLLLASTVITSGCAANAFRIEPNELQRLANTPPETRSQAVQVSQQLKDADGAPADRVDGSTTIVYVPSVRVSTGIHYGPRPRPGVVSGGGGGVSSGGGSGGGTASSGKDAAIAILVMAAVAMIAVIAVEGSRFDGDVQLHPMHPVHLYGRDGGYVVAPMAWIDPELATWAEYGVVRPTEGPWRELRRRPLWRQGPTYALLGGSGSFESAVGDKAFGPSFSIQLGYYFTEQFGIVGSLFLGWRDNVFGDTMFETRSQLEAQYMPIKAGPLHAGLFGAGGVAYRYEDYEDGLISGRDTSLALSAGALFQLELHTRIALTARLGATHAHGERMTDMMIGLSVY